MNKLGRIRGLFIAAGVAISLMTTALNGSALTLTSTVSQSGYSGFSSAPFPLTDSPYDFTSQDYLSLTSIDSISVTLTMRDGDTAPGNFDRNALTLGLDGINTGLLLNGFPNSSAHVTLTLSGTPSSAASILSSLQSDGLLVGTVIDADPNDNSIRFSSSFNTTLELTGLAQSTPQPIPNPEPASFGLLALGIGGLVWYRRRNT